MTASFPFFVEVDHNLQFGAIRSCCRIGVAVWMLSSSVIIQSIGTYDLTDVDHFLGCHLAALAGVVDCDYLASALAGSPL